MCLKQIKAERNPDGGRPTLTSEGSLRLPCGKCSECQTLYALDWSLRARHEMSDHSENCFLTLTYNDESLPSWVVLQAPFQRFIHELRRHIKKKVSYMVSHEYGSQFFRPHHHAIIFGYDPKDQKFLRNTRSGHKLFTSPEIEKLWPHGFHSIGQANEKTAYYIASYALKGKSHQITLPQGEIVNVKDSFKSSVRPAIGRNYFYRNYNSLIHSKTRLPRYYCKLLSRIDSELFRKYEDNSQSKIRNRSAQELLAKHVITEAKNNLSGREFREEQNAAEKQFIKEHLERNVPQP